ncbi:hypothetical protein FIV42_18360 [Persicimonas caeni]|uniref:Uncharacterized protein n=1 Tax=Persicimonas caeni TaxID=2292766 RepID=A0A4Y6PWW5_PERCE|nr:hypothetical protein [Persicimonas caeni]QDG52629.1 hypothetical protein FIV42_18360 [Persicimonas caeni]QED33851.1 hypothetical protein FRD00_18355 [Persicimonas caeni]
MREDGGLQIYGLFGCRLISDRVLPFERDADREDVASLTLIEAAGLQDAIKDKALSCFHDVEDYPGGPRLRVSRADDSFLVEHGDFALQLKPAQHLIEYSIDDCGRDNLKLGAVVERVALPLYLLLAHRTMLGIHASTVQIDEQAWSFVGSSGAGKSTTAGELLKHGGRLVADDLTLYDTSTGSLLPGAPALRLWSAPNEVPEAIHAVQLHEESEKRWFRLAAQYAQSRPTRLSGLIVLEPLPAERHRTGNLKLGFDALSGQTAFAAIMPHVFSFSAASSEYQTRLFRNVLDLAGMVRVIRYRYLRSPSGDPTHVPSLRECLRDLECLSESAEDRKDSA